MNIILQTRQSAFRDDNHLSETMEKLAGQKIELERANYDDGTWSGWFALNLPGSAEAKTYDVANELLVFPGITNVMLKTDAGQIIAPPEPNPVPQYSLGARLDPPKP